MMSGTSADGVDIAACEVNCGDRSLRNVGASTYPYPEELRSNVLRLAGSERVEKRELMGLSLQLGSFYANMIGRFLAERAIDPNGIDLIGLHGQTIGHLADRQQFGEYAGYATLQVGEAELVAKHTGIVTVSDFRSADIAVGGAAAPLAPIYHALRFSRDGVCRAVVNIGGIANVTVLLPDGSVKASDSGPGNCLLDEYIRRQTGAAFDRDGKIAGHGSVQTKLAAGLLANPLLSRRIPRSYDRGEMVRLLDDTAYRKELERFSLEDAMATLSHMTVATLNDTTEGLRGGCELNSVLVCGGGALNRHLTTELSTIFKPAVVASTVEFGSDPEFVEAEAFAYLANLTLDSLPGNLPQVTGAEHAVVLGKISQP
jgi:anhydro-N-acetylmuramic acid kinase